MATRRNRRLYGKTYYNRYNRYNRRTAKSKAIGNYKAANQQKDAADVSLNILHKCSTQYAKWTLEQGTFITGVYAINIWDLLRKSEFYASYANMYDQVKINRVRIKLTPTSMRLTSSQNQYKAITVVTAWDRSGLSPEQIIINGQPVFGDTDTKIGAAGDIKGIYLNMNEQIGTYSSAQTRNLNPNSSMSIVRYLYPSSMQEKSLYINTADLLPWYDGYDFEKSRYYGIRMPNYVKGNPTTIEDSVLDQDVIISLVEQTPAIKNNPAFILEDSSIPFKPTFLIGVQSSTNPSLIDANTVDVGPVTFTLEADVGVTFRGLRKAKIVE